MEEKQEREQIVVPKDLIDQLVEQGSKRFKLYFRPEAYIEDAIVELERQLSTARTTKRKQKLQTRIEIWKKELEVMKNMEKVDAKPTEKKEAEDSNESTIDTGGDLPGSTEV